VAYLILPTQALADEIFATQAFDPSPEAVLLGMPVTLADGRLCFAHPFTEEQVDWLSAYVAGIEGAEVLEGEMPYPIKEVIEGQ